MRYALLALLLIAAHFSLVAFAPATAGQSWILWPFAADSQPVVNGVGGLPQQSGAIMTPLLAGIAGLGFLAAAIGLFGRLVPDELWLPLIVVSATASIVLYMLYFSRWALLPLAIDVVVLWGVLVLHWSIAGLRGA